MFAQTECNITDFDYLLYLRENFPPDLRKVLAEYQKWAVQAEVGVERW